MLEAFEWPEFLPLPLVDHVARIAVLVDEAVGGPRQVVLQRVGRELRQRSDSQEQRIELVEFVGQMIGDDADESGSQPALRDEDLSRLSCSGQRADHASCLDIFRQIEIADARLERRTSDSRIQRERQR